jgi:hypothetical protein
VQQLREQNGGYHRWSQTMRIHVGLAQNTIIDEIRRYYPKVDRISNVFVDRLYTATEASVHRRPIFCRGETYKICLAKNVVCRSATTTGQQCCCGAIAIPRAGIYACAAGLGRLVDDVPQVTSSSITGDT